VFVSNECLNRFSYKAAIGDRVFDTAAIGDRVFDTEAIGDRVFDTAAIGDSVFDTAAIGDRVFDTAAIGDRVFDTVAIGDRVLTQNIAIGGKFWVHNYDPENKRQSMEYRHPGFPSVKKFRTVPTAKKSHVHHLLGCKGRALHGISD